MRGAKRAKRIIAPMAEREAGFRDLRAFLDRLRRDRDLVEVEAPVDPWLEAAEIHRRVIAAGGPALLFRNPAADPELRRRAAAETVRLTTGGADTPVPPPRPDPPFHLPLVTNLFGTARRAELAFGRRAGRLIRRLVELAETLLPPSPGKLWSARDLGAEALRVGMRRVRSGPVAEVVARGATLDGLPITTSWPGDGGPFLTLPLVYTEHPDGKGHNLGIYRMQAYGPRELGMHWQIGKGGGFHYAVAEARGEALPVTVTLGGPPALLLAAVAPLPENVPELVLASLLAGERLPLCPGPGPHPLVASAELALSGSVAPRARRPEGPFGDHYGYYSLVHDFPVFTIDAIARRRDAILPVTVVGKPRQEDFFVGDLLQ